MPSSRGIGDTVQVRQSTGDQAQETTTDPRGAQQNTGVASHSFTDTGLGLSDQQPSESPSQMQMMATPTTEEDRFLSMQHELDHLTLLVRSLVAETSGCRQTSYNGSLSWKIRHFTLEREKAISNQAHFITSPRFYTSSQGYKMCVHLFPDGMNSSKGMYLSIALVLMKGKFDKRLPWLFRQRVHFSLKHRSPCHWGETCWPRVGKIVCLLHPESRQGAERPTNKFNKRLLCSQFISLQLLAQSRDDYLRDDTLSISVKVDTNGL